MPRPEDLPIVLFPRFKGEGIAELPEFFGDAGCNLFSEKTAAVFRQFDLGRKCIFPVKIVLSDRKTEVHADRGYCTMNWY